MNGRGELIEAVDALCRVVLGDDKYEEAARKFQEELAKDEEDD